MTKNRFKILFLALITIAFAASFWNTTSAQRRKKGKGRDSFSHRTKSHRKANCSSCHKSPTSNWTVARGYPDIADYPGHSSCINCHREDFFRGNRPTICSICHVNVSPRGKARFRFPVRQRSQEFSTIFPHDIHQDIIASNEQKSFGEQNENVAVAHFVKANFKASETVPVSASFADDEKKTEFNNCAICHETPNKLPKYRTLKPQRTASLLKATAETFRPTASFFKDSPNTHASCFNCHYRGQQPISSNCAGCHQLRSPYFQSNTIRRYSLKFDHTSDNHVNKDCTTCHVRITQTSDLRNLIDADVPIMTCSTSSCHGDEISGEVVKREKSIKDKQSIFQCNYCHTSAIGSFEIPASHLR